MSVGVEQPSRLVFERQEFTLYRVNTHNIEDNRSDLSLEGVGDERQVYRVYTLNTFLYNVIAVLIFNTLQHVAVQLLRNLHL